MSGSVVTDIESAILAYLALHPDAADTAAGVQRWWVPRRFSDGPLGDVEVALAQLVARGVLAKTRLPDGSVIFGAQHSP